MPRLLVVGSAPHANSSLPWQQQVVLEERGSWFAPRAALVTPRMPVAVADPPPMPAAQPWRVSSTHTPPRGHRCPHRRLSAGAFPVP